MPGGGLFALVAYGSQNVLLSGNPDFSYFYKTYKKYSHFAEESVTFTMDGPTDLSYNQPIQVRHKIQRVADLVRDMYLIVTLPDIFCKYIDLQTANRSAQYNFAWVNFIGCYMIQNIAFFIGGQKIQEYTGEYMIAKAQCDLTLDAYKKWETLIGNVPELTDPANGIYGGGSTGTGYPLVYGTSVNRPSIAGRQLQIPLPFWFSETSYDALPLIALQQQECEVQIMFRPINQLYRVLDANGYQVAPGYRYNPSTEPLQPENVYYTPTSSITDVTIGNFLTDVGVSAPLLNTWSLNPSLQMTYIYLTDDERTHFSTEPLYYLVRQVTSYSITGITKRQFTELDVHNPIERILFLPRRSDSLVYRNQVDNFTNWLNPKKAPYIPSDGLSSLINLTSSTGKFVLNGQQSIMRTLTILGDGNPLQEEKPYTYFTQVVPWKYLTGIMSPNILVYPFALASPSTQPRGSINSSRIKSLQVDLNVYELPSWALYQYEIGIYVESLNWVTIRSGTGGLKYAL